MNLTSERNGHEPMASFSPGAHSITVDHPLCKAHFPNVDTDKLVGQLAALLVHLGKTAKVTITIEHI